MATDLGTQKFSERAVASPLFTFMTRIIMWLGAGLAGLAVWIFLNTDAKVSSIATSTMQLQTDVAVIKNELTNQGKDVERLNRMFYGPRTTQPAR